MTELSNDWNKTRVGRLEVLYREGLSFSLIAADMGVSRGAVIGKAHRLHLPKRKGPPTVARSNTRKTIKVIRMEVAKPPPFVPEPGRDYRCTIYDLHNRSCRFPLWGDRTPHPERFYCGVPVADIAAGIPYCPHHMARSGPFAART